MEIHTLPVFSRSVSLCEDNAGSTSAVLLSGSRRQSSSAGLSNSSAVDVNSVFTDGEQSRRRNPSSTRYSFLDSEDRLLSISSTVCSDMSGEENINDTEVELVAGCKCSGSNSCSHCCAATDENPLSATDRLLVTLEKALGKIDLLTNEMTALKQGVHNTNVRLGKLESDQNYSDVVASSAEESGERTKQAKCGQSLASSKKGSVETEKEMQFNILPVKVKDTRKKEGSQTEEEPTSEVEFDLQVLKYKSLLLGKQKQDSAAKVAATARRSGVRYAREEYNASGSSSGTEYEPRAGRRRRKKIKSGANVSTRPVIQTELWPHTIANEDDGNEVTSESITFTKFLACFF